MWTRRLLVSPYRALVPSRQPAVWRRRPSSSTASSSSSDATDPQSFYSAAQKEVMQKTKALHASIMPLNEKVRSFVRTFQVVCRDSCDSNAKACRMSLVCASEANSNVSE